MVSSSIDGTAVRLQRVSQNCLLLSITFSMVVLVRLICWAVFFDCRWRLCLIGLKFRVIVEIRNGDIAVTLFRRDST